MKLVFFAGLRSVAAVAAGYAVVFIGTVITFEIVLGGIGYTESAPPELLAATFCTFASGVSGGFVAAALAGRARLWHASAVLIPLILDSLLVLASGISQDPVWFDLMGSATLMASTVAGGWWWWRKGQSATGLGAA